ncbi:DUF3108 domain-containing protein [Lichenihabitans sp. PAMC28606]|uniref:DUF3108 domain-containing protein n=1 Tax=Lichenihabitans sp. PAMC28606 TaxID=2880932 RepID=UPI001D0B70C2|nr:DUF3108 domain-containing protein [Lichenihabitans sp. PAMC28606]UDL94553.1 DUF3108 domain-containing protein [Lichenihabitans sp. PAMC28606]
MILLSSLMRRCRAASLFAAAGLLAVVAAPTWGSAAADTLKIHYAVTLIGLPIGTALVSGVVEPNSYRIEANAKLIGLASMMSSSKGAATATGSVVGSHIAPATYATTSANSVMTRTLRMAMNAGTVSGVEITPPFDSRIPRVPVTEADKRNIVDPLSAFVMAVPPGNDLVGASACDRTLPVFDGATRFDLALAYVGTRHVKTKGYNGDVSVCSARYHAISGHRMDGPATKFMEDNKSMEVWLAPISGTHVVFPYRISLMTMIGTTVIEADEFAVDPASHASIGH